MSLGTAMRGIVNARAVITFDIMSGDDEMMMTQAYASRYAIFAIVAIIPTLTPHYGE